MPLLEGPIDALPCNLVVMSDGGLRKRCGSAAWVIFASRGEHLDPLHLTYKFFPDARSAFQCEMIAMSEAVAKASDIIFSRCKYARRHFIKIII